MAKGGSGGNKSQLARIAFLDKAAQLLINGPETPSSPASSSLPSTSSLRTAQSTAIRRSKRGLPLHYNAQLCAIARKTQTRLPREHKRRICKVCKMPLVEGLSSETRIENKSRNAAKACADVRVVECSGCGAAKRFPIGATRQMKKADRPARGRVKNGAGEDIVKGAEKA